MMVPALDRQRGDSDEVAIDWAAGPPGLLAETMTVNRILRQYPATKLVFDALCIDASVDGCDCLDEVAWRHGMENDELIAKLERAIRSGARTSAEVPQF